MEQWELDAQMQALHGELRKLGIPVSKKVFPQVAVNSRAKRRLGCCILRDGTYTIEISSGILDQPDLLRQTLIHELLHTCRGCQNHGDQWKAYAAKVKEAWGCPVQRTEKFQGAWEPLRRETVKYMLECQACGAKIQRIRMSKAVKYPWRYRCKCGGRLKRVL